MTHRRPDSTLVVIPVRNAHGQLASVVQPLLEQGFDLLVVDDGSDDNTSGWVKDAGVPLIRHPDNRGVGAAYKSGAQYAIRRGYDWMITIDGDGQYSPCDVARVADTLARAPGVVTGRRFGHNVQEMPRAKVAVHLMGSFLFRAVTQSHCLDASSGLRGFPVEPGLLGYEFDSYGFLFEQVLHWLNDGRDIQYLDIKSTYPPDRIPVTRARTMGDLLRTMLLGAEATDETKAQLIDLARRAYVPEDFTVRFTNGNFDCRLHREANGYLVDCDHTWVCKSVALINEGVDLEARLLPP